MKFTGVIVNLDSQPDVFGDIIGPDCDIEISQDMNVTYEFNNGPDSFLGVANLTREASVVKYEIDIRVEKLPEEILKKLVPCIGGSIVQRDGRKITKCKFNNIGLSIEGNADPRIKPLGDQT